MSNCKWNTKSQQSVGFFSSSGDRQASEVCKVAVNGSQDCKELWRIRATEIKYCQWLANSDADKKLHCKNRSMMRHCG